MYVWFCGAYGTLTLVRPGCVVKLMSMGLLSMRPVKRPPCRPRKQENVRKT